MKEIQLDEEKIQQMAEKYALEGAEKAIRDYYTSYNSPYVKALEEHLRTQLPTRWFDLPDLTAAINKALSDKISTLCNQVVAQTYIRIFDRMMSGNERGVVSSQDIYRHYCDYVKDREDDDFDSEELECEIETSSYGFKYLLMKYNGETEFRMSLYEGKRDEHGNQLYNITGLPHTGQFAHLDGKLPHMSIKLDENRTASVPITPDVLSNEFMAYIANILIHGTKIILSSYHYYDNNDED